MKNLLICICVALLTGCYTVPSPETVAQGCAREYVAVTANGHSTERLHTNRVSVRCEDRDAYEHADQVLQSTRTGTSSSGRFDARDPEQATSLSSSVTKGKDGLDVRSRVAREEKTGLVWSLSSGIIISH